jgi:acetate kinase
MSSHILVLNAGSSSLKFAVYELARKGLRVAASGQIEGIGTELHLEAEDGSGTKIADQRLKRSVPDAAAALEELAAWLRSRFGAQALAGVGHRVVHGGSRYSAPVVVTPQVLEELRELNPLAPLHQPHNLAGIAALLESMPQIPQVACFDTGFHRGWSAVTKLVPLPAKIDATAVQRYGFHGLSYEYIASVLPKTAPEIAGGRVVVAHLGSGASLCALAKGKSIDCTFGFSTLDGLCMGTRPGSLDPGVVLYLLQALELSPKDVERLLYKESGLLGISGSSNDMRKLLASAEPRARLAIDYFVQRVAQEIGALAAVLGGLDGLVFTAGIGERSAEIRERISLASAWIGVAIDRAANAAHGPRISAAGSRVSTWVIPTDEELMIARHTCALLELAPTTAPNHGKKHPE